MSFIWIRNMDVYAFLLAMACVVGLTATSDIFSSTAQLRQLAAQEPNLATTVKQFVDREEKRIKEIKRTISRLQRAPIIKASDIDHPINVYNMITRWRQVMSTLGDEHNSELVNRCREMGLPYMSHTDHLGALAALIRLQRTYSIPTDGMYRGIVKGVEAEHPLTPDDAFELGKSALIMGEYNLAAEWGEIAAMADPAQVSYSIPDAKFELAKTHYFIGDYASAAAIMKTALELSPFNQTLQVHVDVYSRQNESMHLYNNGQPYSTAKTWHRWVPDWKSNYERLCRGEANPRNDSHRMFCRYRKTKIPYYRVKEEVLSVDPWIAQLYEVIHDEEIETIKEMATPQLYRAQVGDPAQALISEERVSKVAWLWDTLGGQFIHDLSRRVSLITGLDTQYRETWASAEPFQIVNYGIGGQYEPHWDFYEDEAHRRNQPYYLRDSGERISTFMFYLSDVKAGGATVFPQMEVHVPPVKGAAAYWFNIKKNGDSDYRTQHAGCPVLMGEKWVANKWIREYGQERLRPCGMTPDSKENGY